MSELEAPSASRFCHLMHEALWRKTPDVWHGSSYRYHPHGVFRRGVLLVDDHNVNNYCRAQTFTVQPVKFKPWHNESRYPGDPHPHPAEGEAVTFYSTGRWQGPDGPWRAELLAILAEVESEVAADAERRAAEEKRGREEADAKRKATEAAALAAWGSRP